MQKVLNQIIYCSLLIYAFNRCSISWGSNLKLKNCPEEITTLNGTFEWKANYKDDVNYVVSEPDLCWQNDTIVLRQCDFENGEWLPKQVQCEKFQSKNIKCPDDLTELFVNNEYVCLKISPKEQNFDEHFCYGSNYIIGHNTDSIDNVISKFLLEKLNITSFWMPIKRYEETEFNPYVIRLPGKHWNDLFIYRGELLSTSNQTLKAKNCIVSLIQEQKSQSLDQVALQVEMADCGEVHHSVCVIRKHFVAKSGCPQDFGALSHRPNECYGITWDGQKYPEDFRMLQVTEYLKKLNTINIIFKEFDIENDKYVEVEGTMAIPNGKWALKPKDNHMKIVSSQKKLHGLCLECVESRKNVEMLLRLDSNLDALILTVYNKFYIWSNKDPEEAIHCFTNADYEELSTVRLKKIWENDSQTKTIFKLKVKSDDPGQYWCEAHTIFNFTHVSSSKVIAAKAIKGHAFAVQLQVPLSCYNSPIVFSPDQMKHIAVCIKKNMKYVRKNHSHLNELSIHNVRIMDIVDIHPATSYLRCLCHVTASIKSSSVDTSKEGTINDDDDDYSIENENGMRSDTAVRMRARNLLTDLIHEMQFDFVHPVLSTEFCFPENEWLLARFGQSATKSKLCLQKNGLPITRRCLGGFLEGAYWEQKPDLEDCINFSESSVITSSLYNMEKSITLEEQLEETIKKVRQLLESNLRKLIPADLYYLANIMRNSIKSMLKVRTEPSPILATFNDDLAQPARSNQNITEITLEIERIFNFLLEINERVIRPSITLNSTNILLDTFEYFIDYVSSSETSPQNVSMDSLQSQLNDDSKEIQIIQYLDVGVVVKIANNFLVFVISPQVANVTGIALFRAELSSGQEVYDESVLKGAFKNEYYRFILANQSSEELLNEDNILMGTYVPDSLWQRLDEISILSNSTTGQGQQRPEPKIVIKIYANDKLFQETNLTADKAVNGKIISISIPGHDKDLPEILPLVLSISNESDENYDAIHSQKQFCSYWNYQTWASDGVGIINRSEVNSNTVLCGCSHLTPFAYLIGGSYNLSIETDVEVVVKKIHKQALDIITILGCSLSLFGIAGILVTACTFRSWRKKANSKVLLQLSAAIALEMILFCFVNTEENSLHLISNHIYTSCIAIGACLHYSVLVQFCWMVIIAYLQFKRYVQVFGNTRPKRFFMKATMSGWGLPLIPVACVLVFDSASYIPHQDESTNPLCYPSGISFYTGIVLPISLVIIANFVIFIIIIYNILKNPVGAIRHTEKSLVVSQLRLLVLLFFLLGFTWIFGLLNAMKAGIVFSYLFCLTATLQGFILFVYFVVMDPVTRRLWYGYFAKICGVQVNKESFSSIKDTTDSF